MANANVERSVIRNQLEELGLPVTETLVDYIFCMVNDKVDEAVVNLMHPTFGSYHNMTEEARREFVNSLEG